MQKHTATYAFETQIVPAVSTAQSRTEKYDEDGAEPMGRFGAKTPLTSPALLDLGKEGA